MNKKIEKPPETRLFIKPQIQQIKYFTSCPGETKERRSKT
jgi:hypothetical protein